jgi:3-deoxy-D-manno-octulosonic-acid transferase
MRLLYNLFIGLYGIALHCASPFHKKASLWVKGRKNWERKLREQLKPGAKAIWVHCASLGEFEQGRPLIEALRAESVIDTQIILTFFSPSGYEIRKEYKGADVVCYLPLDTPSNARTFLEMVRPEKIFFIKYEFWFNYLSEIKARNTEAYLVSAIFRKEQLFFKGYGQFARKGLEAFTHIFVQDEDSKELLSSISYNRVSVTGDTRFDRVYDIALHSASIVMAEQFKNGKALLVAGSTWEADEELLLHLNMDEYKLLIAPHEISDMHIQQLVQKFSKHHPVLFSKAGSDIAEQKVLIIDNVGMLSSLYKYATVAYVGGGFGKGIHNVLEPAVFGMPVCLDHGMKNSGKQTSLSIAVQV